MPNIIVGVRERRSAKREKTHDASGKGAEQEERRSGWRKR
jgi:hypothetical protein